TLLAAAGLDRLGLGNVGSPADELLPAASQGAVGVETLKSNGEVRALLAAVNDDITYRCVMLERSFLAAVGGDCHSAIAAHASVAGDQILLGAELLSADGREIQAGEILCPPDEAGAPAQLARQLLDQASPGLRSLFAA
ncbi:MAG TPA: hydroxymethylbilane synthase, partial [Allosphingosinicella sp.]